MDRGCSTISFLFCLAWFRFFFQNKVNYIPSKKKLDAHIVDIIFFPPSICVLDPENLKNINFLPWGRGNIKIDVAQPVRASEHSKFHFRLN